MPLFSNSRISAKYINLFRHLFQAPLNNSASYLNYLQRMHKSGPHARPIMRGPLTEIIDPKTKKTTNTILPNKDILAYTDRQNWNQLYKRLTDKCGSPTVEEMAIELYGAYNVGASELTKPEQLLTLKKKGEPNVIVEEIGLENVPKAVLGGDIPYAILSLTPAEYDSRLKKLDELLAEIDKVGIVEGSGEIREYVCAYAGPYGLTPASEVLAAYPLEFKKVVGKSQYLQNKAAHNILVKDFTPRNFADSDFTLPSTDKPHPYVDWKNTDKADVKEHDGTAEEAIFEISGAYTGHAANAIIFKLNNGKTIVLMTEAEMVSNYIVEYPDGSQEERFAAQNEIESPNVINRMHKPLFLSTEPDNSISGIFEEEEIQLLINKYLMASGSVNYYVTRPLPNPRAAFAMAAFLTMGNGLPVGPYIAEGGLEGNASNCIAYNELINIVGGGNKSIQYSSRMDEVSTLTENGRNYAKYFGDRYLQSLKKIFQLTSTYGGNVDKYLKSQLDAELVDKMPNKEKLTKARKMVRHEIIWGEKLYHQQEISKGGVNFQLTDDGETKSAEEFFFLAANAISYLALKNRVYEVIDNYKDLTDEERKMVPQDELAIIDKVIEFNKKQPKDVNKIVQMLSKRNTVSIMVAVTALTEGLVGKSENEDENLAVSLIKGDMMFVADAVTKGNVPDVSNLDGKLPPL
jgi:hypothetical protein